MPARPNNPLENKVRPKKEKPAIPDKIKTRLYPAVLELFSNLDFHRVNIREISTRTGISSGTIYKYFSSKEDLIFTILDEQIAEISRIMARHIKGMVSIEEIFRKVFWVTMDFYDKNPGLAITAFITVPMRTWMQEESYQRKDDLSILKARLETAAQNGEIDPDISFAQITDAYYMICHRHIHNWYYRGMTWKLTEKLDDFFVLFWKMVRPVS